MKTAQKYFDEYAVSHQNTTNQKIHFICVPLIFFSVIGVLFSIPSSIISRFFGLYNPLLENWAFLIALGISIFFFKTWILVFYRHAFLYFTFYNW